MRAFSNYERILDIIHYGLFILLFIVGIHEYHQLKLLEAQVQWITDPLGITLPGQGYEEAMRHKVMSLRTLLPLLGAVFLTEKRFWHALSWLREKPDLKDNHSRVRFAVGVMVLILLLIYIGLTVKYLMVVRGIG